MVVIVGGCQTSSSGQGVQQIGKPGEPGNVREFENWPKKTAKSQGILRKLGKESDFFILSCRPSISNF